METTDNTMATWKKVLIAAVVIAVLYFAAAFMFNLWPFGDGSGEDETEQVDPTPAPIVQIEIEASDVKGEYQWGNIPADKQALLIETNTPNLNGEKVLLAYKVVGLPSGKKMIWIQTEAADGTSEAPIRNVFTDEGHVVIWN